MWQAIVDDVMPNFWPPRPNAFWSGVFEPFRRWYLQSYFGIVDVAIEGMEKLTAIGPSDGVLIAPNHSHDSDPHVMIEVSRRAHRQFYFMAAWQIFRPHRGLDGWCLQRMGVFSVDRESCDRRAVKQAVELLTTGQMLVVFPEGEVYHLNERLTPLLEGVAFMALTAQRELEKTAPQPSSPPPQVWIVPTAIRYRYIEDIRPKLEEAIQAIESRMLLVPGRDLPLHERIVRVGELALTIKEKEILGHSRENEAGLPGRISFMIETLLKRNESTYLKESPSAETVPLRVKALRRHLLEIWTNEQADPGARRKAREALNDVQLVLQLFSYPGDYIAEKPSIERMAETIEKFEEDLTGSARPKGKRHALVRFGDPIDLRVAASVGRPRKVAVNLTDQLEKSIKDLMVAAP
jgi:1-acyl-sn-glycerol-3-phosphate acyltransferase